MVGLAPWSPPGRRWCGGSPLLIPCSLPFGVGGVAGWNANVWPGCGACAPFGGAGSARCWVLRRHPCGVFLVAAPGLGRLTHPVCCRGGGVGVVVVVVGRGVVVC